MVPPDATRVEDLRPGDLVWVQCLCCSKDVLLTAASFVHGLRLPPHTMLLDFQRHFRCRECGAEGKAAVSVREADGR